MEAHLCVYEDCEGTAIYAAKRRTGNASEWIFGTCNRCGRAQMADGRGRRRATNFDPTLVTEAPRKSEAPKAS